MPLAIIIVIVILLSISHNAALPESIKEQHYRIIQNRKGTNGRLFRWFLFFILILLIIGTFVH